MRHGMKANNVAGDQEIQIQARPAQSHTHGRPPYPVSVGFRYRAVLGLAALQSSYLSMRTSRVLRKTPAKMRAYQHLRGPARRASSVHCSTVASSFELSKDAQLLQQAARKFARAELPALAQELEATNQPVPREWCRRYASEGFLGVNAPTRYGGLGLGLSLIHI